jgi:NADPH-dependent 2,4-dienoyl-CoA reductase/sulfur reductase-like enzyme
MTDAIAIVGGDAAGMSAASFIARSGEDAKVTVFERSGVNSYAACGLPYHVSRDIHDPSTLLVREPSYFTSKGIDLRLCHEVVDLDTTAHAVTVLDRVSSTSYTHHYDKLLLATGASAIVPPVAGGHAANVFSIRHYDDSIALVQYIEQHKPGRGTVIGASYLGLEMAEALRAHGLEITLAEGADHVLPAMDSDMTGLVHSELVDQGTDIRLGEPVVELEQGEDGSVCAVRTASARWECDLVVLGLGARPNIELASKGGVDIDVTGAIGTTDTMMTNVDGVWAAGDCVSSSHRVTGATVWIPLGPAANKQGRVAGSSMIGGSARFGGVVGTSLVKVFDLHVGRTGLTETEARRLGMRVASTRITADDIAHYYPGSTKTTVKIVADATTSRLLGAQIVGRAGVPGRTNVVATALQAGMSVGDLADVDLGYAPPFAPVWDPLLVAANRLGPMTRKAQP